MDNQYLPNLNFQPYVKQYVGLPLKEIAEASSGLREQYDANIASADAIELAARQLKSLSSDDPIKQEKVKSIKNTIDEIAKSGGRWEFQSAKVRELAKSFQGDEDLMAIAESYRNAEEERKLYQQLSAQGQAIRFKPSDKHQTIIRNEDGTVTRNIYTGDTQQQLQYRQRMETFFDNMEKESNKSRTKNIGETTDANGNVISIDRINMSTGISKDRIVAQAKKSLDSYLQTNEGRQQFRVLTELGDGTGKVLTANEAKNQIQNELIIAGMERKNMSYDDAEVQGVVKSRGNGSGGGNGKTPNLPNGATMPIALKKINSNVKSVSDVDNTIKALDKKEDDIATQMTSEFVKKYVHGVPLTTALIDNFKIEAKKAIEGKSTNSAWNSLAKQFGESISEVKLNKDVEAQRLIDASNYAFVAKPELADKVSKVENLLEGLPIVKDEYDVAYSPKEIYNLLLSTDGKRLVKDGYNTYAFEEKGKSGWVKTHFISGDVIKGVTKLIDDNKQAIKEYAGLKDKYLQNVSAKAITQRAEVLLPGRDDSEQKENTKMVNDYFSKKSNLIKTAGDIVPTDIDGGEIQENKNLATLLKDINTDDIKLGTVGLNIYDPSGQKTWVMTLDVGDKTYEVKVPYNNYPITSVDAVLNNGQTAASYSARSLIEKNKTKGVSLVPIPNSNGKLKYNVETGEFEGLIIDNTFKPADEALTLLEQYYLTLNNK